MLAMVKRWVVPILLFLIAALNTGGISVSQVPPTYHWYETIGEQTSNNWGLSVDVDSDYYVYVVGVGNGYGGGFIAKLNSTGYILWFLGVNSICYDVTVDDSNVYITTYNGITSLYKNASINWSETISGEDVSGNKYTIDPVEIVLAPANTLYFAALSNNSIGWNGIVIGQIRRNNGSVVWLKYINISSSTLIFIDSDASGNLYLAANTSSGLLLAAFNGSGSPIWSYILPKYLPVGLSIGNLNGVYVVVRSTPLKINGIIKISDTGQLLWAVNFTNMYFNNYMRNTVSVGYDGGIYVVGFYGTTTRNITLVKMFANGTVAYSRSIGRKLYTDTAYSILAKSYIYITGEASISSYYNIMVILYSPNISNILVGDSIIGDVGITDYPLSTTTFTPVPTSITLPITQLTPIIGSSTTTFTSTTPSQIHVAKDTSSPTPIPEYRFIAVIITIVLIALVIVLELFRREEPGR